MARLSASSAGSEAPEAPPPVFVGGDPSLDLVNTIDWAAAGPENERLTGYERLLSWGVGAGALGSEEAEAMRRRALRRSAEAAAALARARGLRAVLQRLFHEVARGSATPAAWRDFDPWLAEALGRLRVTPRRPAADDPSAARWRWDGADERLDALLWPVAWAAARLLTSDEARRIRVCDGPDCGWVYVDRSRNHLRRWCQMKTCGTSAKTRRRRRRREA